MGKTLRYGKLADYSWTRAHCATSAKWRTFWFNQFEVAVTFAQMSAEGQNNG